MSRLTDLLRQLKSKDPQLAADLSAEVKALSMRRAFGLNFERHQPEAVELPRRPVRIGDLVRVLPLRGSSGKGSATMWRVTGFVSSDDGVRCASLTSLNETQRTSDKQPVGDLVVVARFRDPIYPGLRSTGRVERGGDKPFHVVINGENYHALQTLLYTHEGGFDCIYIDPPYNTRDKDWKYNNDYVDTDDAYKHSKWLAMMERRLTLAKRLLKADAVLIVAIDEKECLRLGLLLEQIFFGAQIQMVTTVISAKGAVRPGQFSRVEEYLFCVTQGAAKLSHWTSNMLKDEVGSPKEGRVEWLGLRRREPSSVRGARPNQFYPIFVGLENGFIHSIGEAVDNVVDRRDVVAPEGTVALWPLKPDGTEMLWGLTPPALRDAWRDGCARVSSWEPFARTGTVQYLPGGTIARIKAGTIAVTGRAADGSLEMQDLAQEKTQPPKRVWNLPSHNAETGGTNVLRALIPGRSFPYPKSLYAVEDALRFFVADKPDARILDFFAGSGTTAHAVARLNRQDGGRRQSFCVTNNEVSDAEARRLRIAGFRPGDKEWERVGICEFITKPRVEAAFSGVTAEGSPLTGTYRYTDEFPMSEGFEENVEFFDLTYESPRGVAHSRAFAAIAPLLWMKSGARGRRINGVDGYEIAATYAVLVDLDLAASFVHDVRLSQDIHTAFIVTNDDQRFQMVCLQLPQHVKPFRLFESYLSNFEINSGRE